MVDLTYSHWQGWPLRSLSHPSYYHKKRNGLKTFNNIISRAFITSREAHTFKGILRRLKNKLGEE